MKKLLTKLLPLRKLLPLLLLFLLGATRLYLPSAGTSTLVPGFAAWTTTTNADRLRSTFIKTGTTLTNKATAASTSGTTSNIAARQYLSDPLSGPQTITGTCKGVIRTLEAATTANAQANVTIRVLSKDGVTVRGTLLALSSATAASEFPAALANRKFPLAWVSPGTALTSVSALDGDRICVELGARFVAPTSASTATLNLGDASADLVEDETSTTANAPWLEFSQTLTFQAVPEFVAAGTYLVGVAGTTASFAVPAGGVVDDIATVVMYKENASVVTPPAGFTEFITVSATNHTQHVFWKRLTGADTGTYDFSWTGSAWREGYAVLWRNCVATGNPYESTASTFNNTASTTTLAVSTTPLTDNSRILWVATSFGGGNPWTPPAKFTRRTSAAGLSDVTIGDCAWNGLVATGSLTGTATTSGSMTASVFALKPAGVTITFDPKVSSSLLNF